LTTDNGGASPWRIPGALARSRGLLSGAWFGNTGFEATPSVSVTLVLRAIAGLTRPGRSGNIGAMVRPLPRCEKAFNGPEARCGPDKHQGTSASFLTVGNAGRWVRPTYPLAF
jgi:hypothetical protein